MADNVTRFDNPRLSDKGVELPVNLTLVDFRQSQDPKATANEVASAWCRCQGFEKSVHEEWNNDGSRPKGAWRLVAAKASEAIWKICSYCNWHFTRIDCANPGHATTRVAYDHVAQENPPDH